MFSLDHLQISIPAGEVDTAVAFYTEVLGFERIAKSPGLDPRGAWLRQGDVNLHLGEESPFTTDGCAHPAFCVANVNAIAAKTSERGLRVRNETGPTGYIRKSIFDPFGNRIELMEKLA